MKIYCQLTAFILLALAPFAMQAQTTTDSVKQVINALFTCMKNGDGDGLRSVFADSTILQTIVTSKDNKVMVRNDSVAEFADFVSKAKAGDADERIEFETIKIDGGLATVWAPYKFYFKGKFSHCGVNSFQLVKLNGFWKIQYLIDTRRKSGCAQ